jgi:hypothetical protein
MIIGAILLNIPEFSATLLTNFLKIERTPDHQLLLNLKRHVAKTRSLPHFQASQAASGNPGDEVRRASNPRSGRIHRARATQTIHAITPSKPLIV